MTNERNRFDYIGFANGGKEVGSQPPSDIVRGLKDGTELALRTAAIPFYKAADAANAVTNAAASAGNWALGKLTGYEVPYEADLPTNMSGGNSGRAGQIASGALEGMGLRKTPEAMPTGNTKTSDSKRTLPKEYDGPLMNPNAGIKPGDLSALSNGAIPAPRKPASPNNLPGDFAPYNPELTPMGTFQVEGGPKRSFSADSSGSWYEGGNKMGGIMGAPARSGNPAVDEIVNRLMSNQPSNGIGSSYNTGIQDPAADAKFRSEVEQAVRVNAANGMAPTTEQMKILGMRGADLVTLLGAHNKDGRYDKQIGDVFKNEFLENARGKLDLERMALPIEADVKGAQGDYYRAHAKQLLTMSDPDLLLKIKGKDADTERAKGQSEIMKTLLPKAYDTANDLTKKYLEQNPNADANAVFNNYLSNAMSAFTDQFSQGKRYAPGINMPGEKPWFGFNSPEVNVDGGWGDPSMSELYKATERALLAAGEDGVKRTSIMNRFNELRGRFQGIPTQ
jgi:hypothetical protein